MLAKFVVGLTITITLTVGPYVLNLAHTIGGETRVSHAISVAGVQKGQSRCVGGCPLDSKIQNFETVDLSAPDLIALNANRSDGEFTADVGVYKNVSISTGKLGLGLGLSASATKTIHDEDAIRLLRSQYVKALLPQSFEKRINDYEVRHNMASPRLARKLAKLGFASDTALKAVDYWPIHKLALPSPATIPPTKIKKGSYIYLGGQKIFVENIKTGWPTERAIGN